MCGGFRTGHPEEPDLNSILATDEGDPRITTTAVRTPCSPANFTRFERKGIVEREKAGHSSVCWWVD